MIIMYLRKSRSDDPTETIEQVLARHERQLQEYAVRAFGAPVPEEHIYREIVSGETIENRPEMTKILSLIESPSVNGVLVIEPQRLSRGDLIDCGTIIKTFKYSRTKIYTPMRTYDLWDKYDERFVRDELLRGREYLEYTKEILMRGRRASANEGNYIGSQPPYGYDKIRMSGNGKKYYTLVPNENEAAAVRMIFDLYAHSQMGYEKIAVRLNEMGFKPRQASLFSKYIIFEILRNPVYAGKIAIGRKGYDEILVGGKVVKRIVRRREYKEVEGKHPPIISEEVFSKVQSRIGSNPRVKADFELQNPLTKLLKCSCGASMRLKKGYGGASYVCTKQRYCRSRNVPIEELMPAVTQSLSSAISDFEVQIENEQKSPINHNAIQLESLKKELEIINETQERLFSFLESGTYSVSTFKEREGRLSVRRQRIEDAIQKIVEMQEKEVDVEAKVASLHLAFEALNDDSISATVKNELLLAVIDEIVYTTDLKVSKGNLRHNGSFHLDVFLK